MRHNSGSEADVDAGAMTCPIARGELILRREKREITSSSRGRKSRSRKRATQQVKVAGPHVHHEHTDAFYVLEGELTFEIGREAKTITLSSGGFVAVPPGVAHSLRNGSDRPARWLTIHAPDGGFAAFMRGVRDGIKVEWDISAVGAGVGLPACQALISQAGRRRPRLRNGRITLPASAGPVRHSSDTSVLGSRARLHTHCVLRIGQLEPKEEAPLCGGFAEPSDGLEPSTPSLPERVQRGSDREPRADGDGLPAVPPELRPPRVGVT